MNEINATALILPLLSHTDQPGKSFDSVTRHAFMYHNLELRLRYPVLVASCLRRVLTLVLNTRLHRPAWLYQVQNNSCHPRPRPQKQNER